MVDEVLQEANHDTVLNLAFSERVKQRFNQRPRRKVRRYFNDQVRNLAPECIQRRDEETHLEKQYNRNPVQNKQDADDGPQDHWIECGPIADLVLIALGILNVFPKQHVAPNERAEQG